MEERGGKEEEDGEEEAVAEQGRGLTDGQKLQVLRREFLKLREEHGRLLADTSKLKVKAKLVGMLQEDRGLLMRELAASNDKLADLVQENQLLKDANRELLMENNRLKDQTLKLNRFLDATVDDLKRSTVQNTRTLEANKSDKVFQERFSLPDTEPFITSYSCFDAKMRGGKLYLSPHYLCFATHFPSLQGGADVVIKLKDIRKIRKEKSFPLGVGCGRSLHFHLSSSEVIVFKGLINREKAVDNILEQSKKFGTVELIEE